MISPIWLKVYQLQTAWNRWVWGMVMYCWIQDILQMDSKWIQHAFVSLTIIFHDRCGNSKYLHSTMA